MDWVWTELPGFPAMPDRIDVLVLGGRDEEKRQTSEVCMERRGRWLPWRD